MNLPKLSFIILFFVFPTFCLAQESPSDPEIPKKPITIPNSVVLLPNSPESWAINLHKQGGIIGINNLLVAINSNGQYLCENETQYKTVSIDKPPFTELSEMIDKVTDNISAKPINESLAYCNDCIYNTLSFYRNKPDVKTFTEDYANYFVPDAPTVKEIYVKVWQVTKCGENPKPKNKKS
ncbi:MAG: hypothetical protein K1X72_09715 [Pyrinomonadaceae bacterium]|nr:hypothetical protein [Pyrinomonadaceae bacterium]